MILDTNILSELRKIKAGRAHPAVAAWAGEQDFTRAGLSAVTIMEVEIGILRLHRYDPVQAAHLRDWFEGSVLPGFHGRILPVDSAVARRCAALHVPVSVPDRDALIAATALVHDMTLATRNTRDFAGMGVRLVDPFTYRVGTGSAPE
ncbi:type II toxin-antitoxin system VapC family toxin [Sphingomonas sp. 1P08PE]|uniref:type II toxin-antitoxin system VapC family toxin n=1 Tax=Sphingomonas sp. 1P08PE TaxID=554122 RepID=UPI0039A07CE0